MRWIEGSWRGTGDVETPFYERYHFENDSTLVVDSFADDKFSKISETSRFELKDGQFGNVGEGARWAAIAIDDNSISFEPHSESPELISLGTLVSRRTTERVTHVFLKTFCFP